MDTLKTAVVVVLLLAVLYGVYAFLNQNNPMPNDLAWPETPGEVDDGIDLQMPDVGEHGEHDHAAMMASMDEATATPDEGWKSSSNFDAGTSSLPSPGSDIASATTAAASAITPPDLLGSDTEPSPANLGAADSEASPRSAYTNELQLDDETNSAGGATASVGDSKPMEDRLGGLADMGAKQGLAPEGTSAELSPRYGDPVGPIEPVESKRYSGNGVIQGVLESGRAKIEAGEWYVALMKLSFYYENDEDLTDADRKALLDLLDPLAGKVIYSNEHLIESAYRVQGNETLLDIATRHKVPWQLLANINGMRSPDAVAPGTELKVVPGPFNATISLSRNELTLFAKKLYAGRFTIAVGNSPTPQAGVYSIIDKLPGRTFYAGDGQTIPIDDPNNPYGRVWIDLGDNIGIHGSSSDRALTGGCIGLSATDANDVFGILSKGSTVTIIR